jgi:PAS domain S-box-containing protein
LDAEQIFLPEESLLLFSIAQRIGDFVDKRENELSLLDNEIRYRDIIENINDVIFEIDNQGIITFISSPVFKIFGYTAEELRGKNFIQFIGEQGQFLLGRLNELSEKIELKNEYQIRTKTGESPWIQMSARTIFSDGNFKGCTGTIIDITERKQAEEKIEKLNRLYLVISHVSQAIVYIRDKTELMNEVCRIAIEFGKFRMAWIGLIDEETKIVKPVAKEGFEDGYLSVIRQISVSDVPEGRGPTGTAIRKGDHFVCDNTETNPMVAPWRSEALKRGYYSSIALPLKQSGKIIGAFTLYSSQPYFFDQEEIELLDEFVNEIGFAFETIETEIERQKAEEKLRKISSAVEQSPVSIVITNLEGTIEYANPKASVTTGYTFEELIGKNPRVLKSGVTPDIEYQKLWKDITSGKDWHGIFHNKRKNGELYWESSTISPITGNMGKITHFLAVKEDITERKLAEQEILKFRTIADQANYGSAITSLDGDLLYINDTFARMNGYESGELLGKSLTTLHSQEQLPFVIDLIDQLKITGSFSAQEVWYTRRDGTVFPALMNASIIYNAENVPQFLSATAIDISEFKQKKLDLIRSENELNKAQELASMGSWEHNLVTGKLVGSKNYYKLLGLEPDDADVNLYDHFLRIVHKDDLPIFDFLQNHQYNENEMQVVEVRIQIPGDGIRWIQNNVVPVFENGCLVSLRGVNIDITEKKKTLDDLIKAKEKAEESDKLKTSFLNNISHEIRTPFNGILGFLSLLQNDELSTSERDEYITFINQSANRLISTINDIIDLSQIQSGQMKLTTSLTNIQDIVNEQVFRIKPQAEIKGLDFIVNYELTGSVENFSTDRYKLSAILFHLIGNAVKFTKSGSVKLTIRGNDRMLEFCVEDTDIGISEDKLEIIFSRFTQADHSNTREFEGSGLGLTIAKEFIEMLNGKLWFKSVEGQGSSFSFTVLNSNEQLEKIPHPAEVKIANKSKDLKILIAEDDEGSLIFLSILMKQFGNEIITARSGLEAVEKCREHTDIDLILMDIRLPVMDGYEATRQIRKFNPDVVIVAQTAFVLTEDYHKAIEAGCNEHISKPVLKDKLQQLVTKFFY